MKSVKSYTAIIYGNQRKNDYLESMLKEIGNLSQYIFSLGKNDWFYTNDFYKDCRERFPDLNSKVLQKFLQLYQPKKGKKLPKKPIKASILIDQDFNLKIFENTTLTNFWLKFHRRKFPIFGKYLRTKILDLSKIKMVQIYQRNKKYYCKFSYVEEINEPKNEDDSKVSAIDVNTKRHVLVDNNRCKFFNLKQLYHRKYEYSKKHNQRKRNIENYTKDYLHKLTSKIVKNLLSNKSKVLVLEDLKNLRNSASRKNGTSKGKNLNFILNSFPYRMFCNFLEYKCLDQGIEVVYINPAYTSKQCSNCGSLNTERPRQQQFRCLDCETTIDADLNGSRNIWSFYTDIKWAANESNPISDLQIDMKSLALVI